MRNEKWKGIFKLMEEAGEVVQVLSKLGTFPDAKYADSKDNFSTRVSEEIADLYAALDYFVDVNGLGLEPISQRRQEKLAKFHKRQLAGIPLQDLSP